MSEKTNNTIMFYVVVDKRKINGKIHFELKKTERFQTTGHNITIQVNLNISEQIFQNPKYIADLTTKGNNTEGDVKVKEFESELNRIKSNEL